MPLPRDFETCPDCAGAGGELGLLLDAGTDKDPMHWRTCSKCDGSGVVAQKPKVIDG